MKLENKNTFLGGEAPALLATEYLQTVIKLASTCSSCCRTNLFTHMVIKLANHKILLARLQEFLLAPWEAF